MLFGRIIAMRVGLLPEYVVSHQASSNGQQYPCPQYPVLKSGCNSTAALTLKTVGGADSALSL